MGCTCSKASADVANSDGEFGYDNTEKETNDIANANFAGEDRGETFALNVSLENLIIPEKDNIVDASCFVALYEGRKVGKGNNMSYVLVGKTETIAREPNPEFVKRFVLYNKNQSLRFEVYETHGSRSNDISTITF